jgi:hypothetical protein
MPQVSTTLRSLQQSAIGLLSVDDFFSGLASQNQQPVPIITEVRGNITQAINLCLGQVGIAVLVLTPGFEFHQHEGQDLSGWAYLTVTVYEDSTVNQSQQGTGIIAADLCERTVSVLHYAPTNVPTAAVNSPARFLGIPRPVEFISPGPPFQYNVIFKAHVTLNPQYQ